MQRENKVVLVEKERKRRVKIPRAKFTAIFFDLHFVRVAEEYFFLWSKISYL